MASPQRPKRIAFLDTNALIDLFSFWETCRSLSLALDKVNDVKDIQQAIARTKPISQLYGPDLRPMSRAMTLFREMSRRYSKWDFFCSEVSRSEMHHTLLESRALERLTQARVSYRLRSERPLIVYRRSLTNRDYASLDKELSDFFQDLDNYGLVIQIAEKTITDRAIVSDTASRVWSRVLLEVMDAFIYASSITSMANVLITRDGPFYDVVNNLFHPQDEEWRSLKRSLSKSLGEIGPGRSWPEARRVQTPFPRK